MPPMIVDVTLSWKSDIELKDNQEKAQFNWKLSEDTEPWHESVPGQAIVEIYEALEAAGRSPQIIETRANTVEWTPSSQPGIEQEGRVFGRSAAESPPGMSFPL